MGRRLALALALLVGAACTAAGSAGGPPPGPGIPKVETPAARYAPEPAPRSGGTATVGLWQFPLLFSPILNGQAAAIPVEDALFDGLTGVDSSLAWYGDLAQQAPTAANGGVQAAGAGMDVHYRWKPGLEWSDGQPITLDDVVFTWQVLVGPANTTGASRAGYELIRSIEPEGQAGFVIHFTALYPAYLSLFGTILPSHRLKSVDPAALALDPYWIKPDVVSGPFTLKEAGQAGITLQRNPLYAAGPVAHLDQLVFKPYPTKQSVLAAAKAGEIQVGVGMDERDLDTMGVLGDVRAHLLPALQLEQVSFNQTDPNPGTGLSPVWARDPEVLQALDLAADRPALFAGPLRKRSPLAASPISPQLAWAYDASQGPPAYDLAGAKRLLDADGWQVGPDGVRSKAGRRLSFVLSTTSDQALRAEEEDILVAGWKKLGADVRVENFTPSQLFGGATTPGVLTSGGYEAALWAWIYPPDPDAEYDILHSGRTPPGGSNYSRCHDAALDAALDGGRNSLDAGQRAAAYRAFQQAYSKARCELPLYQRLNISVASPRLHNYAPNPAVPGNTWNAAEWWLSS